MKRVYLIHGWGGNDSSEEWFGWLKQELRKRKIEVISFNMPNTNLPKIEEWTGYLKNNVKKIDEETYFIGHSIGCQTTLRFLEKLPEKTKVGGCIFVAGWFNLIEKGYESEGDKKIALPWIKTPINFEKIKKHTNNFLAIFSDDDPFVPISDSKLFKEKLNAKVIIKKRQEHFCNVKEIPEIIPFLIK